MKKLFIWILALFLLTGCAKTEQTEPQNTEPPYDETAEAAATSETEAPQPPSVTISMVGDVLLHETVSDSGRMEDSSYRYDHLFQNIQDEIARADISIVNQEVILGAGSLASLGTRISTVPLKWEIPLSTLDLMWCSMLPITRWIKKKPACAAA